MLTQRLAKCIVLGGSDEKMRVRVQPEITNCIVMFDEYMQYFKASINNSEASNELVKVEKLWETYKKMILTYQKKPENVWSVVEGNTSLLESCISLRKIFERDVETYFNESSSNKLEKKQINIYLQVSGNQRTNSQRLCMAYTAYYFGVSSDMSKAMLENSFEEIAKGIKLIFKAPLNLPEIDEAVTEFVVEWRYFHQNKEKFLKKEVNPEQVYELCQNLMAKADKVMSMYEKL